MTKIKYNLKVRGVENAKNNIKQNTMQALCEIIESKNVHDLVKCKCEICSIDGGYYYLKRSYKNTPEEDFIELSKKEEI